MEILDILIAIIAIGIFVTILYKMHLGSRQDQRRSTKYDDPATMFEQNYNKMKEFLESQINDLKDSNRALQNKVNRESKKKKQDEDEELEEEESGSLEELYEIDIEKAGTFAKQLAPGMDVAKMIDNPLLRGTIWNYIEKNRDTALSLGIIRPKQNSQSGPPAESGTPTQPAAPAGYDPNAL